LPCPSAESVQRPIASSRRCFGCMALALALLAACLALGAHALPSVSLACTGAAVRRTPIFEIVLTVQGAALPLQDGLEKADVVVQGTRAAEMLKEWIDPQNGVRDACACAWCAHSHAHVNTQTHKHKRHTFCASRRSLRARFGFRCPQDCLWTQRDRATLPAPSSPSHTMQRTQ
jgi:hypothetical protein